MKKRPPTLTELVAWISEASDEQKRAQFEDWYWAKVADRDGVLLAHWHRREYDWLIKRQQRLDEMRAKPALGAFPSWSDRQQER